MAGGWWMWRCIIHAYDGAFEIFNVGFNELVPVSLLSNTYMIYERW